MSVVQSLALWMVISSSDKAQGNMAQRKPIFLIMLSQGEILTLNCDVPGSEQD
jgi:hypothetical protein